MTSPVVDQALDLKAGIEGKFPEIVQTGYTTALNKAVTVAASLDATLCSGVDTLVEKVPALKQSTPVLYNLTRENVGSYATQVATYVASFTIAQIFLKAADLGSENPDGPEEGAPRGNVSQEGGSCIERHYQGEDARRGYSDWRRVGDLWTRLLLQPAGGQQK